MEMVVAFIPGNSIFFSIDMELSILDAISISSNGRSEIGVTGEISLCKLIFYFVEPQNNILRTESGISQNKCGDNSSIICYANTGAFLVS